LDVTPQRSEILATVARLLEEVMGSAPGMPITLETSFAEDLELESIEFVALAERLQIEFGDSVDFVGWLADKELDDIIALRVGDLVEFLEGALRP
jgi:acyl carrier protein